MTEILAPNDEAQAAEAISWAHGSRTPLEVVGTGSKRALGRPLQVAHTLDLSGLSGVTMYEPNELVMSARAGTPLAEVKALLDDNRQRLAFEPADYGPLLGLAAGLGTVGGLFACNLAGPRRLAIGAARDHILGVRCVSGRGEAFKTGGRVVKNVTGFDLPKLLAGSYGTLAAITELTFKVLPQPEKVRTVLLLGLDQDAAVKAMTQALHSCHEVSGAAHLPAGLAARSGVSYVAGAGRAVTAIRIEGPEPSVAYRCAALRNELGGFGPSEELHSANSRALWRELRDVAAFVGDDRAVWRLALPPSAGGWALGALLDQLDAEAFLDRGGGQLWLAVRGGDDAGAAVARGIAADARGTATLVRAPAETRGRVDPFTPLAPPMRTLTERVKDAFDPARVLNPGRMHAGL